MTDKERLPDEPWHALDADAVVRRLESSRDGLSEQAAFDRCQRYGHNVLEEQEGVGALALIFKQLRSPLQTIAELGDRKAMVWTSTPVTGGRARAVVAATGMDSQTGEIARDVQSATSSFR